MEACHKNNKPRVTRLVLAQHDTVRIRRTIVTGICRYDFPLDVIANRTSQRVLRNDSIYEGFLLITAMDTSLNKRFGNHHR